MNTLKGQALQIVILGAVILAFIAIWGQYIAQYGGSLVVLTGLVGTVGGVANNFRRLQKLPERFSVEDRADLRWMMTLQIYVSPLVGALFALVLYITFMAEILQGSLFPTFASSDTFTDPVAFTDKCLPATNLDAAKVLFWSFVAGFAEGFVPNFIDKAATEAAETPTRNEQATS